MTTTPVGTTRVEDLLRTKGTEVHTVSRLTSIVEVAKTMTSKGVGSLVVTDGLGIAGIVTERDCLRFLASRAPGPPSAPVSEIMTRDVVAVTPETTLEECMAIMTDRRCRHLPVVSGRSLAGLVSIGDLVKQAVHDKHAEIHYLTEYIMGQYPGVSSGPQPGLDSPREPGPRPA